MKLTGKDWERAVREWREEYGEDPTPEQVRAILFGAKVLGATVTIHDDIDKAINKHAKKGAKAAGRLVKFQMKSEKAANDIRAQNERIRELRDMDMLADG